MCSFLVNTTTVPTPEGDVQVETKLEIPVEDNKEDVKSEAKSPKVKNYRKKNLPLQQFPKRNFLKDLMRLNKIVPDISVETTNEGSDSKIIINRMIW